MTLPWYPRDMGKYARDTAHLSMLEDGAYNNLLDHYYSNGGLPCVFSNASSNASLMPDHSRLHRLCKASTKAEQEAVDNVLFMFFVLDKDGYYRQSKCDEIIAEQLLKHQKRVNAGRKGGEKKASSNATSNASSNAPQKETKTKNIEEDTNVSSLPKMPHEFAMPDGTILNFDQLFERWWVLYPAIRDKGSKTKAKEQLKIKIEKGIDYEIIGRGIAKYRGYCDRTGEKQPDMFRWLRDEGFNRDYATTEPTANTRNGGGYSIEAVLEKALADKTHDPEGRDARLAALGICYDTSDQ